MRQISTNVPAISINENQSLIAINIINNNPLIIIDWFNQSIKIDTHSPNDHYRNTRLDFVFVLQFTVRQNVLMLFLDPGFHHC